MTKEWADVLLSKGYPADLALAYDRVTGVVTDTLGSLAAKPAGSHVDTFHFALNNYVSHDNRIPPYGMRYDEAKKRNALPVPADQFGNPGLGGVYQYWDEITLNPPTDADHAHIQLLYQGTSWEYIQFLQLANNGTNAFIGAEGDNMMDAWINADVPVAMTIGGDQKMVPPVVMATANWGNAGGGNNQPVANDDDYIATRETELVVAAPGVLGNDNDPDNNDTITAVQDSSPANGNAVLNADGSFTYTPSAGFTGFDSFAYHAVDSHGAASNSATVTIDVRDLPACGSIGDKGVCNGTPGCEWQGSPRSGSCVETVTCIPTPGEETQELTCNDGIDNDCDGAIDAADADCGGGTVTCSDYHGNEAACKAESACRWKKNTNECLNR